PAAGAATGHRAAAFHGFEVRRRHADESGRAVGASLRAEDVPAWKGYRQPARWAEDLATEWAVRLGAASDDVVRHLRAGRPDAGLQFAAAGGVAGDLESLCGGIHRALRRAISGIGVWRAVSRLLP